MTSSSFDSLLELMQIGPRDRILELNCGEGECSILLAARVPEGMVAAVDPSDDCVRRARVKARELDNIIFTPADEAGIPWKEGFFSQVLSHGLPASLADVLRVLVPGGTLYVASGKGEASCEDWRSRLGAAGFLLAETRPLPGDFAVIVASKPG